MNQDKSKWYIFVETSLPHNTVDLVRGYSIDDAIDNFCLSQFYQSRKFKNGRWRWGNDYYDSAKELIASCLDISLEIKDFQIENGNNHISVFCSIDWFELMHDWDEFYMNPKTKVGECYEWYSPDFEYYALFRDPNYLVKRFKEGFSALDSNLIK